VSIRPSFPVTRVLVALMVLAFGATVALGGTTMWGGGRLFELGALYAPAVWAGDWWRLLTWIFLHGGLLHLFVNSLSLVSLGRVIEPTLGAARFLVVFFLSGLVSGLATLAFVTDVPSVGASGAVFGLAGLLLAEELTRRRVYRRLEVAGGRRWRPQASIVPALVLNLALGVMVPVVNNYAHVGGLLAGFLLGTAWIERNLRHRARSRLAYLALGALIGALAVKGAWPGFSWAPAEREGTEAAEAGDWERAYDAFSRAIEQGRRGADVYARRAQAAGQTGRLDQALADVNEALARDPGNPGFRYLRAAIHHVRGDRAAALADGRAACDGGVEEACRGLGQTRKAR
jgi:rhomboid protease GluP